MVGWRHWLLGKLNKYSCLGFRDKAEQASDLAFNLPGHCPDCEWLSVTACCDYKTKMGEKSWDCWGSWRGSGQPSPRLNYIPSFTQQNKQHQHETRAVIWSQIDDDINLQQSWDYKRNQSCNLWSLTHRADVLPGTLSQLGLQMCCDMGLPSTD